MNRNAIKKELQKVKKQEARFLYRASSNEGSYIQSLVNRIIPKKLNSKLNAAFGKAFSLIFSKGRIVIKKTYSEKRMKMTFEEDRILAAAADNSLSVKSFHRKAWRLGVLDGSIAGLIGIGLGLLGRGLIDIPMFVSVAFRDIYLTALCYGFDYEKQEEQYLMMKMMGAAISSGETAEVLNEEVDELIQNIDRGMYTYCEGDIGEQMKHTSEELSNQILYLKFLQLVPIAGAVAGCSDIVYLSKVHRYINIKYRKRFLLAHAG